MQCNANNKRIAAYIISHYERNFRPKSGGTLINKHSVGREVQLA